MIIETLRIGAKTMTVNATGIARGILQEHVDLSATKALSVGMIDATIYRVVEAKLKRKIVSDIGPLGMSLFESRVKDFHRDVMKKIVKEVYRIAGEEGLINV